MFRAPRSVVALILTLLLASAIPLPARAAVKVGASIPFKAGTVARISQSPGGSYSHNDDYNRTAVDWAVAHGTPIVASETGTIYFEGWSGKAGIMALIDHGGDACSQYAHLSSTVVDKGQRVLKGQVIGYSGASANGSLNGTQVHLHWAGVYCSSQKSRNIISTVERGTSYPKDLSVSSVNRGAELTNTRSGRCLDVQGGSTQPSTPTQLYDCNATNAQRWLFNGTTLKVFGSMCLDILGGALRSGTRVQSYGCNGTTAQKWQVRADRTIRPAAAASLCLSAVGGGTANGTRIEILTCNGSTAQQWS